MSAPLIDRQQIAARHGLSYRYVRDTLTKRPDFPAPAQRLSCASCKRWARSAWACAARGNSASFDNHPAQSRAFYFRRKKKHPGL